MSVTVYLDALIISLQLVILVILIRGISLIPRIQEMAEKMATDIMNKKIKEFWDHREDFKKPIMQFVQEMGKDMAKNPGSGQAATAIMAGNMEIPLGFLPKKYQGLAQLALMFFGKKGNGGNQGNNRNPWE